MKMVKTFLYWVETTMMIIVFNSVVGIFLLDRQGGYSHPSIDNANQYIALTSIILFFVMYFFAAKSESFHKIPTKVNAMVNFIQYCQRQKFSPVRAFASVALAVILLVGLPYLGQYQEKQKLDYEVEAHQGFTEILAHENDTEMVILHSAKPDKWGNPIKYDPIRKCLVSAGPDGVFGTNDDLVEPDILIKAKKYMSNVKQGE